MKFIAIMTKSSILFLLLNAAVASAQSTGGNPSFVITESKTTREKVENVDYASRKVTLKDESGKVRIVRAGSDIHNLNNLKIGDVVTIETFESISGEVKPGPGEPLNVAAEGQTSPLPGEKPSGIRTIEGTLRTRIESVDYDKRTVSFKGRRGDMVTYRISPEAKRFNEIRRGDMLWVEYSQTITLLVK